MEDLSLTFKKKKKYNLKAKQEEHMPGTGTVVRQVKLLPTMLALKIGTDLKSIRFTPDPAPC